MSGRLEMTEAQPWNPESLVGSFFWTVPDSDEKDRWQGCIVAEPYSGVFLVQLLSWLTGEPTSQRLVSMKAMDSWRFYDDDEALREGIEG